ncbi:MAG: selenocysteine-specific translation elongation factor [Chloroflexi bacterium]|nr:selenocysteine-specific translation elongation factor [Chloroflexota bacterium]
MFVIGTAGHVDHGKSALVQALTGIDPDRLREEKERGMTIDLGFAWLKLPSGREVGVVDVPGHERFVSNMLAGVGGIDLALLIVAADEGIMPQTREHLAILDLLDIKCGIVVITKVDLVDEEFLSLVKLEVEELMNGTSLAQAQIIPVSAITMQGLPELVAAIDQILMNAEPKRDIGRPRLAIDRAFTIAGSGTVVTGTLIDGSLMVGQDVEVVPSGLKSRLRGLQTHKTRVEKAFPGSRVAANLVGVATSDIERGDVLTKPGWLVPTARLDVKLRMLGNLKHPLRHGSTVVFFTGSAEVMAKVHLLEKEALSAGETSWAQFALDNPVAVVRDDHFVIRSPMDTLGGGVVVNSHASRHRRFRLSVVHDLERLGQSSPEDTIVATLEAKQPVLLRDLLVECNLPVEDGRKLVSALVEKGSVMAVGSGANPLLFSGSGWQGLVTRAKAVVQEYHGKFPARPGMPKGELSSKMKLAASSEALQKLFADGVLVERGGVVSLPDYQVKLTAEQQKGVDNFLRVLNENPYSPPGEVTVEPDLLNLLVEQGKVVKVADGVVFSAVAYQEMVDRVLAYARANGKVTLAEVRDMFDTSRKYAKALLEHMDKKKLTRRVGDERVAR